MMQEYYFKLVLIYLCILKLCHSIELFKSVNIVKIFLYVRFYIKFLYFNINIKF